MIKLRFGKRRGEESLRPLSEREIQEKLYGSFHLEEAPQGGGDGENRESIHGESRQVVIRERASGPVVAPPGIPKKERLGSFWKAVSPFLLSSLTSIGRVLKTLFVAGFRFGRALFRKLSTRWGISILAVAAVFIAIQSLNAYRTKAMRAAPKVTAAAPVTAGKSATTSNVAEASRKPALAGSRDTASGPLSVVIPPEPASQRGGAEPPIPPVPLKPYVIQICSYAREEDAQRLTAQMVEGNLPAFYQQVDRSNGKAFYLVFLGRFETFREAQSKLDEFRKNPLAKDFGDSFVRSL